MNVEFKFNYGRANTGCSIWEDPENSSTSIEDIDGDIIDYLPTLDYMPNPYADPAMVTDTMDFQKKYGLWDEKVYGFLPDENMKVKVGHLKEEMVEIEKALENKDLSEFCDGIIDLVYVALGTLNLMNMPVKALWNDVHVRNMQKIRATADNMGKRGSTFDVIKPEGWTGPRTSEIIDVYRPTR